ncbi:MAG: Gfo/Idh/MocA family oxidoreductase [Bdellovibrionales bacterium]
MAPLRMAVIGVGHLGKEHARILAGMPEVDLVGVADVNGEQANIIARKLGTRAFHDYWPLLNNIDAASIVVPTTYHFQVAKEFLKRGIPVLIEKPLAATMMEAESLVDLAEKHQTILQVGHIERFNGAYGELLQRPIQPKFISAERLGPFTGRSTDIGVVLDLMIHDIDLILNLVQSEVVQIEAIGVSLFGKNEDVANARLHFSSGCVAELTASRASPTPSRRMRIWAPEGCVIADFHQRQLTLVQPSDQLRQRLQTVGSTDPLSLSRFKDIVFQQHLQSVQIDCNSSKDQLSRELEHFVDCVNSGQKPMVTGQDGLNAISVADRIFGSLQAHQWNGVPEGPVGPAQLPEPQGKLFRTFPGEAAA